MDIVKHKVIFYLYFHFQIPIFRGTYSSLVEPVINEEPFHGIDGFGDCNHDEEPDLRHVKNGEHATNALIRLVKEYPGNEKYSIQHICLPY